MKKKARSKPSKSKKAVSKKSLKAAKPTAPKAKGPVSPLGDRVLLRPLSPQEMGTTSQFGIIIPDTIDKEKPEQGIVMAVGPGKLGDDNVRIPVMVAVGDRVVFSKYGFDEVKVGGKEYYLVSEQNILAIITK